MLGSIGKAFLLLSLAAFVIALAMIFNTSPAKDAAMLSIIGIIAMIPISIGLLLFGLVLRALGSKFDSKDTIRPSPPPHVFDPGANGVTLRFSWLDRGETTEQEAHRVVQAIMGVGDSWPVLRNWLVAGSERDLLFGGRPTVERTVDLMSRSEVVEGWLGRISAVNCRLSFRFGNDANFFCLEFVGGPDRVADYADVVRILRSILNPTTIAIDPPNLSRSIAHNDDPTSISTVSSAGACIPTGWSSS